MIRTIHLSFSDRAHKDMTNANVSELGSIDQRGQRERQWEDNEQQSSLSLKAVLISSGGAVLKVEKDSYTHHVETTVTFLPSFYVSISTFCGLE